ncbi:MAG: radical SAM protein [Thermodesulfobacteriota bacterium]|nr:radical SAM protein [Thermodesulfobacteriota bacterium]
MRVLLVSANTEVINMPVVPVGLGAVAAATVKAGHEVALLDLMNVSDTEEAMKNALEECGPHVIGISVRNIDDQVMAKPRFFLDQVKPAISSCRALSDAPIVLGGAGYSIFAERALAYLGADMGIQGEGEMAFPALLSLMEQRAELSEAPGLCLPGLGMQARRQFARDLDLLPLPDPAWWSSSAYMGQDLWIPVQTRRGCPMRCTYCSTSTIEGTIIRKRDPLTVVDAMEGLADAGFHQFFLTDNIFNIPSSYALEFCQVLADRGLPISWRGILYPRHVDEALVRAMAKAGCKEVALGFESGSREMLEKMNKKFGPEDVRRTSEILQAHGIRRMGFLLLGGPGETKTSVTESLAMADSLKLEAMKITIGIRIYPHTAMARIARSQGVITGEDDLLFPKFYLARGLEDWLREMVDQWTAARPHWRQ